MSTFDKIMDVLKASADEKTKIDKRIAEIETDIRQNRNMYNWNGESSLRAEIARLVREKENARYRVQTDVDNIVKAYIRAESDKKELDTSELCMDDVTLLRSGAMGTKDIMDMFAKYDGNFSMQKVIYNHCEENGMANDLHLRYIPHAERVKTAVNGVPYMCAVLSTLDAGSTEYGAIYDNVRAMIGDAESYDVGLSVDSY